MQTKLVHSKSNGAKFITVSLHYLQIGPRQGEIVSREARLVNNSGVTDLDRKKHLHFGINETINTQSCLKILFLTVFSNSLTRVRLLCPGAGRNEVRSGLK
jgi:hypothetical protein